MKVNLQQQIYFFALTSCLLFVILVASVFWSAQVRDIALEREKYANKVENHTNIVKQFIHSENIYDRHYNTDSWFSLDRKFSAILRLSPPLTPQQQTIQNSIESQNKSVLRLFNTISEDKLKNANEAIKKHLKMRLITQLEAIRSDSIQLSTIAHKDIKNVVRDQIIFIISILVVALFILFYGAHRLTKIMRISLKEITIAFEKNHSGDFHDIKLSNQTEEFNSIVNAFNAMNKKLSTTTVSLESMKKIVAERTHALEQLSMTDALTQVANRRALFERGYSEFSRMQRNKGQLSVILLDCDLFKNINDKYGHLVGDDILKRLCDICVGEIRDIDFFARYGGEEFIILLPDSELIGAVETAKRIQRSLAKNCVIVDDKSLCVTVSIGICVATDKHKNFEQLIDDADSAMYRAKANGRNRIETPE